MVAPRLVLHIWDLVKNKRYDEYDELMLKLYVDPTLHVHTPEEASWVGMGEGPQARLGMETLGLELGPAFPAQQPPTDEYVKYYEAGVKKSGLLEWVDWKEN